MIMPFVHWDAATLARDESHWVLNLSNQAVDALGTQARLAAARSDDMLSIDRRTFRLPEGVVQELAQAVAKTQKDHGLVLIRKLPTRELSELEFRVMCWGMGLYMGIARPQNLDAALLTDVRNAAQSDAEYRKLNGRGYNTSAELDFHIDSGDVVALFCRRTSKAGGRSLIANSLAICEQLMAEQPALAPLLRQAFPFSYGGYQVDGRPFYLSPLLDGEDDNLAFRMNRKNIVNGAIQADVELTLAQADLIQCLESYAASDRYCYQMALEEGDVQILNNFRVIHSRSAFEDFDAPDERRHLIRLWLSVPGSQRLPASWAASSGRVDACSARGGYRVPVEDRRYVGYVDQQAACLGMSA